MATESKKTDVKITKAKVKVTAAQASDLSGISADQIAEYRKAFTHFDKNKNGTICLSEFKDVLAHVKEDCTDEEAAKLFKEVDVDGKPDLDFNEFMNAMSVKLNKKTSDIPVIREMTRFAKIDKDGNGTISKAELKQVLGKWMPESAVAETMQAFDEDGDGEININEFLKTNVDYCL